MEKVKDVGRRRGYTRLSRKNQVTIPVESVRAAGLHPGDQLHVKVEDGRVILERERDPLDEVLGSLPGVWPKDALKKLRAEWR